ncbi:DEAD/DEAH box helicase [Alicyclobacillus tolerans]|uniref:DEAD/DEAH box helicase n=1 Tax=Alicyclobacillus tolerans TaxID=90970 RepID=UPI001F45A70B|nr:SNF2-related protein [Alicyclobacillus tolerans]MCF8567994.1 DEAD/DEAH box helicase [Alicyclobacillus tolerans]
MPERYFFRFSDHLLELDALEMDETLRHVLRDIPNEGKVLICLPQVKSNPTLKPEPERRRKQPVAKTEAWSQEGGLFAAPILCTVDHASGLLLGDGLGKAFSREISGQQEWVIERTNLAFEIVPSPPSSREAQMDQLPLPAFYLYPPQWLVNGEKSHPLKHHGRFSAFSHTFTFHMEEAKELLDQLAQLPMVSTREVDLHRQAVSLSLRSGFEELLSLKMLHEITPFPHQIRTVERVLRHMRGRALLCDEVGLGKTIEAGIVLAEYMLRGLVKRVLILTPPSLVEQWKEEVTRKLGLDFICYDEARFKAAKKPWHTFEHIIASLDTAKREPHRDEILETEFDLVIVDEAHHLKNKSTLAWKFVNQLKKKYILLLTATPIENDMSELFNLITLLKPGQLLTEAEYKSRYVDKKDPLQPKNVVELKKLVQNVMIRNRRSTTGVIQSTRSAETILVPPTAEEQLFYTKLSQFVKSQLRTLDPTSLHGTDSRTDGANVPTKEATFANKTRKPNVHPFVLKNLLRQAGSSIACTLPTLRKSLMTQGSPEIHDTLTAQDGSAAVSAQELIRIGERVTTSGKLTALLGILENTSDQVVVFTGFVETQHVLTEFLTQAGLDVVNFHGGMPRIQKEQAIQRFREGAKVLVSTESGGEGRNLQFCHSMVNFDIPWNPMRIEQRIGRIHRIGQEHEVSIYNLAARGTMEEHILRILDAKVNLFQLVIGELDMILGSLDEKREFEDILMDIWMKAKDEAELVQGIDELGDELLAAKTHYQKVRDVDDRLLSELIENE